MNANVKLPTYVNASFDNGTTGMIKVEYTSSYDNTKAGAQEVEFKATTVYGDFKGKLNIVVGNEPFIDGVMNEYTNMKKHTVEGVGDIYVAKGEEGLYIAAKIDDNDVWTDGENWNIGDMGQKDNNDDFRVFIATDDASARVTACLSAANLLRVYEQGTALTDKSLEKKNMLFQKMLEDYRYHVATKGLTNVEEGGASEGFVLELYISYVDLGIDDPEEIHLCFDYNNVTKVTGSKTNTNHYFAKNQVENPELDIKNYFSINELI